MDAGLEMTNAKKMQKLSKVWLIESVSVENTSDGGSKMEGKIILK